MCFYHPIASVYKSAVVLISNNCHWFYVCFLLPAAAYFMKLHLSIKATMTPSSLSYTCPAELLLRITFPTEGHSANATFFMSYLFCGRLKWEWGFFFHFSESRITDKELILPFQEFIPEIQPRKFSCWKDSSHFEITISRPNKTLSKNMLFFTEDHVKAMLRWNTHSAAISLLYLDSLLSLTQ